jgi:transcriptional regulator with XRE-family HTH domain
VTVTRERGQLSQPMAYKLAMARASRKWTLRQAAEACGCSVTMAWNLENGKRAPSVELAGSVCRAYQLSREDTIQLMSESVRNAGRDRPGKRTAQ